VNARVGVLVGEPERGSCFTPSSPGLGRSPPRDQKIDPARPPPDTVWVQLNGPKIVLFHSLGLLAEEVKVIRQVVMGVVDALVPEDGPLEHRNCSFVIACFARE